MPKAKTDNGHRKFITAADIIDALTEAGLKREPDRHEGVCTFHDMDGRVLDAKEESTGWTFYMYRDIIPDKVVLYRMTWSMLYNNLRPSVINMVTLCRLNLNEMKK